ncbi:peptide chain release factor N(5)-glutamine methyltransferase [Evansella cellulosilytica]|uniref:Release factor glutamine methyltransferase n=1 Tax=Evansella cellulosilytica (strain ATCC 21833 / DSM 2522 / FERM P-1141 / JCM 9156 / N-4) TaxID=649639 RepID=E6TXC8_EVAC2|nr:peptide chain release factor N(5)-glutamine methyltransferase [Evansella cellulosilytica]ADU32323.1 protein-(glutamine-N5) methyltransferase, release factor-specific [Evansella cellulosilytica DSM 2522]
METNHKVYEALKWASSFLNEHNYEETIAQLLMRHHTGWSRSRLFSEMQTTLPAPIWTRFEADVRQAATGTPVQHIIGHEQFYGRDFKVNSNVLIPRPETEELIEALLGKIKSLFLNREQPIRIVDVGTGSGIIAITLALEVVHSHVHAVDISQAALDVARSNATALGAKVTFHEGDLLEPFLAESSEFDIVISNPPYIPEGDRAIMKENVLDHEPALALFAGQDGLTIYRKLIKQIPFVLHKKGLVAFEIGHGQGESVKALLAAEYPAADIAVLNDINGKERIVIAVIEG